MRFYSLIVPVYNRPQEIDELLGSLQKQSFTNFEVIVVEDGSADKCDSIVQNFQDLDIKYFYKENSGQGFSRKFGFEKAKGDYLIVFDSDCLIPSNYLEVVDQSLNENFLDAYGGPDRAHSSFSPIQKAISYSMTSTFTTGGIRGNKKHSGTFHPRSFNMGISREVFNKTGGYIITRMGEDIELSLRIIENGFKLGLIPDAFVYHKRRTSLVQFYKQLQFFGRARINVGRFYPKEVKLIHLLPAFFVFAVLALILTPLWSLFVFKIGLAAAGFYYLLIFLDSLFKSKSLGVALLSVPCSFVQLFAYGIGFITEGLRKLFRE